MRGSLVLVIGTLVLAPRAWADHTSLHFTATGDVSTTDNLFAAGGDGDRQADLYFTVRPGVLYAYDAPRMIHDFTAELEAIEYTLHSDQPSLSGRGGWRAVFLPGPRSSVTMSIDAGTGVVTSLASRSSSSETIATASPGGSGNIDTQQVSVSESGSYQIGKYTRVTQGVLGRYATTDDDHGSTTDTREVGGNLGFERSFEHDSILLNASVAYLVLQRKAPASAPMGTGTDHQLNPTAAVAWHHDFNRRWSLAMNGGMSWVNPVNNDPDDISVTQKTSQFWVAGGAVAYTEVWGRAQLSANRSVAPNLLLAQNTVDESVGLQVAMPLPWLDDTKRNPKLVALGSLGYAHSSLINSESGDTEGNIDVARADISVGWSPRPGQTFGVRYEFTYQAAGNTGLMDVPSYYRNTLSFTFALRYPDRVAGEVPRKSKSIRSDRSDLVPVGAEPVVTDPLENGGDGR